MTPFRFFSGLVDALVLPVLRFFVLLPDVAGTAFAATGSFVALLAVGMGFAAGRLP